MADLPEKISTPDSFPSDWRAPVHVAIIMDGNGRWANARGLKRIEGHKAGALSVRRVVEESRKLGIRYLTLFSFSTENWGRETIEIEGLMKLFRQYLDSELSELIENGIRLRAVGDLSKLPFPVRTALRRDIERTKENTGLDLILAVSYGGREEIVQAAQKLARAAQDGRLDPDAITGEIFSKSLWTEDIPDPELLIRTSGEMRISNFLLWQLAYTEIVVVPEFWPDFDEACFRRALTEFDTRERRFGLSGEQIRALHAVENVKE